MTARKRRTTAGLIGDRGSFFAGAWPVSQQAATAAFVLPSELGCWKNDFEDFYVGECATKEMACR